MERWTIAAGHTPPAWVIAVLSIVAVVAVVEAFWTLRRPRAPRPRRDGLIVLGLRLLAVVALIGLALEVTLRIEQVTPSGRRVVVLVDRSASMDLADAADPGSDDRVRRLARAQTVWKDSEDARVGWRDDGIVVEVRTFDETTVPLTGEPADTLEVTPDGAASDLAGALSELAQPGRRETTPLAGVVVISDGLVAADDAADGHVRAVAESLGVPVTTVATGAPAIVDVGIAQVRAGEFAFVENVAEFEATIIAHELAGKATTVQLRRDGEIVSEQRIRLPADGVPREVRFEVAPDRIGQFVYEIAVPEMEGEATSANNHRAFVVKVLRDKVRVLHVAGRPDWDVRALRTLLRRDPNVELLSYYILRGMDDISREDTTAPLSLIPFPTEELFEEQLGSFDLVVLHNFDAVRHQVGQYVDNMAQYVLEGGALVLIGGDLGLADGGYAAPAMASVLPIDSRERPPMTELRFRPTVTEAGRRHPITAWLAGTGSWERLPELSDFNRMRMTSRPATIGASALLVHPDERDGSGTPRPILAVAEPGRGRTMVLSTGSTWRLGFAPDLPLIDGARPYDLLWLGAVRWLLRDDSSGRLRLETDRPRYRVGEAVELHVETSTASYAPEPDVPVTWSLRRLDGDDGAIGAGAQEGKGGNALREGQWTTDGLGRARETLAELPVGAYEAIARRDLGTDEQADPDTDAEGLGQHEVRRVFIVEPPGRELARVDADPGTARLRGLAEATGGEALSALGGDTLPRSLALADLSGAMPEDGLRVDARRDVPLWNGWAALLLLVGAFGGEWLVRRRQGEV